MGAGIWCLSEDAVGSELVAQEQNRGFFGAYGGAVEVVGGARFQLQGGGEFVGPLGIVAADCVDASPLQSLARTFVGD